MAEIPSSYEYQNDGREELIKNVRNKLFELAIAIDASNLESDTKQNLINLNKEREGAETMVRVLEKNHQDLESDFKKLTEDIDELKKLYPDDPEVKHIVLLYQELKTEFQKDFFTPIHNWRSVRQIDKELKKETSHFKEKRRSPQEAIKTIDPNSKFGKQFFALQKAGVPIQYLIEVDKNAPTVLIFTQVHAPVPTDFYEKLRKIYEKLGIESEAIKSINKSQIAITEGIKTVDGKVFIEGVDQGSTSVAHVKNFYGGMHETWNEVDGDFSGIESALVHNYFLSDYLGGEFRISTENIFIADYIADNLLATEDTTAGLIIGLAHEKELLKDSISLSSVLASLGINTIAVGIDDYQSVWSNEGNFMVFLKAILNSADSGDILSVIYHNIDKDLPNYTNRQLLRINQNFDNLDFNDPKNQLKIAALAKQKTVLPMLTSINMSFEDFVRIIKELKKGSDPKKVINQEASKNKEN